MEFDGVPVAGLLAALGGGLLIGIERERRRGENAAELPAGVRTCIFVAMIGALAAVLGTPTLIVAGIGVVVFTLASYVRSREFDPGLTTEFALLATFLLGVLAMTHAQLAAGLFVLLTIVLASKESLHRFTRQVLSREELGDALLLAASALIVLPLLPDRTIDPFDVLNPRKLWLFAVLVMAINATGYVALRAFGAGRGLVLAGLLGGFVSSAATIVGMAQRALTNAALLPSCIAAALLSNIATIVQLAVILLVVAPPLLLCVAVPLAAAGFTALAIGGLAVLRARGTQRDGADSTYGRPFAFTNALLFALIVAIALFGAALLRSWMGARGIYAAAAATGLADVHAAAVAIGQLSTSNSMPIEQSAQALAVAFTANSAVKCLSALLGGRAFAWPVIAGIATINIVLVLVMLLPLD
jgi:uncharacterized membrane protein (DUF4010 family)